MAELVTGIDGGNRAGPCGNVIACEYLCGIGGVQINAQQCRQRVIARENGGGCDRCGQLRREHLRGQGGIAVVKGDLH